METEISIFGMSTNCTKHNILCPADGRGAQDVVFHDMLSRRGRVYTFLVNRHLGKLSHPKNFDPELGPFFAILSTRLPPQLGQIVVDACRLRKERK